MLVGPVNTGLTDMLANTLFRYNNVLFRKDYIVTKRTYSVYMHLFPNGKKYVGYTGMPLKDRWDGGCGYISSEKMMRAIIQFGWENVRHYIIMDGLDKHTAQLLESALINKWKTSKSRGYNTILPYVDGIEDFVIPKFKKREVFDQNTEDVLVRIKKSKERLKIADQTSGLEDSSSSRCKRVRLVETNEEFESISKAARTYFVRVSGLWDVLDKPNRTCGTCVIEDPDSGVPREVRAHWVTVK